MLSAFVILVLGAAVLVAILSTTLTTAWKVALGVVAALAVVYALSVVVGPFIPAIVGALRAVSGLLLAAGIVAIIVGQVGSRPNLSFVGYVFVVLFLALTLVPSPAFVIAAIVAIIAFGVYRSLKRRSSDVVDDELSAQNLRLWSTVCFVIGLVALSVAVVLVVDPLVYASNDAALRGALARR